MPSILSSPASPCPPRSPAVSPETPVPSLVVVGVSHRNAPLVVREALAVAREDLPRALARVKREAGVSELMILSTCNRVEVYAAGGVAEAQTIASILRAHACARSRIIPMLDQHVGEAAVRHAFRVAASLDSMVLGEPQVLGQLKDAYQAAVRRRGGARQSRWTAARPDRHRAAARRGSDGAQPARRLPVRPRRPALGIRGEPARAPARRGAAEALVDKDVGCYLDAHRSR